MLAELEGQKKEEQETDDNTRTAELEELLDGTEEEQTEGKKIRKAREGRIDYIYINAKSANICTRAKICTEGSVPWSTDHKAVSITIAGPRVRRREGKRTWQRQMYKTKGTGEAKMNSRRMVNSREDSKGKAEHTNNKDTRGTERGNSPNEGMENKTRHAAQK